MSRLGKRPINLTGQVEIEEKNGTVSVKGSKGSLTYRLPDCISIQQDEKQLTVSCEGYEKDPERRALFGLARSLLQNMVTGVTEGFRRELEIQGVGYRGQSSGRKITLNLGFSHPIEYEAPEGIEVSMPQNTRIVVEGIDKQLVGQVAATLRGYRPPDSYKGKGIRYAGEQVTLKEGKTVA